jgi:hypothetical protein
MRLPVGTRIKTKGDGPDVWNKGDVGIIVNFGCKQFQHNWRDLDRFLFSDIDEHYFVEFANGQRWHVRPAQLEVI